MFLGIDYGKKKIGLAISEGLTASELGAIANSPSRLQQLKEKVQEEINTIVIGLPNSSLDAEIKKFANELTTEFNCKIIFEDESFSTNEALSSMINKNISKKKRRKDDSASAVIILERYLQKL